MSDAGPRIAVFGAGGLVGHSVAEFLATEGFSLLAVARRFTPAQMASFGATAVVRSVVDMNTAELSQWLVENRVDIVVNCIGVLQDGARGGTQDVHEAFVGRLLDSSRYGSPKRLLVHLSIPGTDEDDRTAFSRTKRSGDRLIMASGLPFVILRPGFVIAPYAYGGSALFRALAATPIALPDKLALTPFAAIHVDDISRTVAVVSRRWAAGTREFAAVWDLMTSKLSTVAEVTEAFRQRFGASQRRLAFPHWLLALGARAGDAVARLGWVPPIRSTALAEMRRGVSGNPAPWIEATGIEPLSLKRAIAALPANVQERWFARLFLLKPLIVGGLAAFWIVSGLVALTVAFDPAAKILTDHGIPPRLADLATITTGGLDLAMGAAIAWQRMHRAGLWAGIALSLVYMAGATAVTPELWTDPLGPLVKTGPAIILMAVALAIADDR